MWSSLFGKNDKCKDKTIEENVHISGDSEKNLATIDIKPKNNITDTNIQSVDAAPSNVQTTPSYGWVDWLLRRDRNPNTYDNKAAAIPDELKLRHDDGLSTRYTSTDTSGNESKIDVLPDPKVAEYFDIFPEYYKQRAVERFSNRRGLNRYDLVRDYFMQRELSAYLKDGVFLEDKRLRRDKRNQDIISNINNKAEEKKEKRLKEGIPDWEKEALKYFPLNDGDEMWEKLVVAGNFYVAGLGFLYSGLTFKKRAKSPGFGKWKLITAALGGVGACSFLHFAAYYRLYDLGYFNEATDRRGPLTKLEEDIFNAAEIALDKFLDYIDPPGDKSS